MSISKIFTISLLCTFIPIMAAQAQQSCGQAIGMDMIGDAEKYCSVYDRQLAYREERIKFRQMIEDRREEFIAPQIQAQRQYKKDLEALNAKRNASNNITSK